MKLLPIAATAGGTFASSSRLGINVHHEAEVITRLRLQKAVAHGRRRQT
jgi:hypothetical protein